MKIYLCWLLGSPFSASDFVLECRIGQCCRGEQTSLAPGKGGFGASNEEATSSEMKGNMRRRNRRIGNECKESYLEGRGRGLSVRRCVQ